MAKKHREPSLILEMAFGEALIRFANTNPREVADVMSVTHKVPKLDGLIRESDLVLPALRFMAEESSGFIDTSSLIVKLEELFNPSGRDAEIIEGRSDTFFSQKVRNLISHRKTLTSFIANEYAVYDDRKHGLKITEKGRALLKQLNG